MASRRPQDSYGKRARKEGFAARSVYKLEEIDKRIHLLRSGQRVLDLGAFPGSWTVYAARTVGSSGSVVAVDQQPLAAAVAPNVTAHHGNVLELEPTDLGPARSFDVVLSDMAPATSGQRHADQYRSFELFMRAVYFADHLLRTGGSFVGKIFQGAEFEKARGAVLGLFQQVRILKPKASR